ncbi:MAG: DUF5320 domain-containing protein [Candidatus Omnitrophota bacterium]|jgi:hypothetical protein
MPKFDGMGPAGLGPLTGKGMGYCVVKLNAKGDKIQGSKGKGVFDMPRGDGTGPMGLGPMTGRAAGFCAGYSAPGYLNSAPGRGYFDQGKGFYGCGGGRGRRNWFYATGLPGWQRASMGMPAFGGAYPDTAVIVPKQEADILKNQADVLKKQLEDIQSRIETLEKAEVEKSG